MKEVNGVDAAQFLYRVEELIEKNTFVKEGRETDYDRIMERLDKQFPDKNLLNIKDICEYTGMSRTAVASRWKLSRGVQIDKAVFARSIMN